MQVNLHKVLSFFAVFTVVNILANAVMPAVVFAAEETPVSFPTSEEQVMSRVDILEDSYNYSEGTICGLGDAFSEDGLRLTIQGWYSDYQLWGRYTDSVSTTGWYDLLTQNEGQFSSNETNATYFLPLTEDLNSGDARWEVQIVDSEGTQLAMDAFSFYVITNPEYAVCGGSHQPGNYTISGSKYQDMNGNQLPDFEDMKVPNWTIRLYGEDWQYVYQTNTLADGSYYFSELSKGTYYVCELSAAGWTQVYPYSEYGVSNQSGRDDEAPSCLQVYFHSESSLDSTMNDFVNRKDIATIKVKKSLIDQYGWNTVASTQFGVDLYAQNVRVGVPTQYISADLNNPMVATFEVAPGSYEIIETGIDAYKNMGCMPEGTISTNFSVKTGDEVWVVCTNVKKDLMPEVSISTTPSSTVLTPNAVTLTANVTSGNGAISYAWECTNGQTGSERTIVLSTVGDHRCTVTVKDEDGDSDNETANISVLRPNTTPTSSASSGTTNTTSNQGTSDAEQGISTEDDPDDVLGSESQVCNIRSDVSGYVYTDVNGNNAKDDSEQGIANIDLTFLTNVENSEGQIIQVEVRTLKTNTLGRWDTTFCAGTYTIRLDSEDLSEGASVVGSNSFEFSVEEDSDKENVNFAVRQITVNGATNWWLFLIPLVLLVLAAGGYAIYSTNTKRTAA